MASDFSEEGTLYVSGNYSRFEIIDDSTGKIIKSFDGATNAGHCFPGDTVIWNSAENRCNLVLTGEKRCNITGTLELTSKTIHGFTESKKIPLYTFVPYSKEYPPFIVASSEKRHVVNMICSIDFLEWKPTHPVPRGSIKKIFGFVGDIEAEYKALLEYVTPVKQGEGEKAREYIERELAIAQRMVDENEKGDVRRKLPQEMTFNIDPEGCRDIDDVITLIPLECSSECSSEPSGWRVIVSIADVSSYVPEMGAIDSIAYMIGQSVYNEDGKVMKHMLPSQLSEDSCSLIPGKHRRTISAEVTVKYGQTIQELSPVFYLSTVTNGQSYTYDTVDTKIAKQLEMITGKTDTSDMVATLMIWYNAAAARVLQENDTGIFRRTIPVSPEAKLEAKLEAASASASASASAKEPEALSGLIDNFKAAEYGSSVGEGHMIVGGKPYCHITSPIRRYCDLVNQRLLRYILLGAVDRLYITISIRYLNDQSKKVKKYEKYRKMLKTILMPGFDGMVTGTVFTVEEKQINIMINEWEMIVHAPKTDGYIKGSPVSCRIGFNINGKRWKEKIIVQMQPIPSVRIKI